MGKEKSSKKRSKKSSKQRKGKSRREDERGSRKHSKRDADSGSSTDASTDSSSSDSEAEQARKRQKSEKLAQKVVSHLQRTATGPDAPFVWAKKVEKEIGEGKKLKEISIFSDRNRQQERLDELEKVRKRQAEREAEKARREEELTMVQRMRAAQEAMDSEAKEEEFYLQSLLAKAERRLREGRPTPSDLIARNLHVGLRLGEPADFDLKEPWKYFEALQLDDAEALYSDIKDYAEYDKFDALHAEFWAALLEVAEHEVAEARARDAVDRAHLKGGAAAAAAVAAAAAANAPDRALHADVEQDIQSMLQGQTYGELVALEGSVQGSLERGEGDPEYWQAVLARLKVAKGKAHVRDVHSRIVAAELQRLAQEAAEAAEELELSDIEEEGEGEDGEAGEQEEGPGRDAGGGEAGPSGGATTGGQTGLGVGSAVARAMGWAKERRGVARADGLVPGESGGEGGAEGREDLDNAPPAGPLAPPPMSASNPEEIDLDAVEGRGGEEEGGGGGGAAAPRIGAPPSGGVIPAGPEPAQVVFPSELPAFGRRFPRKRRADGTDPDNEPRRVGGDAATVPDEVIADGSMSPRPLRPSDIAGEDVVHEEEDYRELELMREQVRLSSSAQFKAARERIAEAASFTADRSVRALMRDSGRFGVHPMMRHIAAGLEDGGFRSGIPGTAQQDDQALAQFKSASLKAMGDGGGDRDFGGEVPLEAQVYWWHDKYKPRKPKYFNRVHTGYEWNKYNQTHYDYDNPPPKVVQGYKFNILYHDLIDRTQAPQYVLERDPTSPDNSTCIIRFIAGPPYEDIAFRVVNKEWNYARKHGFRCAFERGILHLFFNFKRTRYRR